MNLKLSEHIDATKELSIEALSKKFDCLPEEICMGDYIARDTNDTVCPYRVIMGFANFERSNVTSLGNLEIVYGKKLQDEYGDIKDMTGVPIYLGLNLQNSKINSLGNVKVVFGSLDLNESITSLEKVKILGSNIFLGQTNIQDLGCLEVVDGTLLVEFNKKNPGFKSLKNLKKVRELIIVSPTLRDFGKLESVKKIINKTGLNRYDALIEKNFKYRSHGYARIIEENNSCDL